MAKPKIFIKTNKNKGICDITVDNVRTNACKRALNMFVGQDIRLALRDCLQYTRWCISGDEASIGAYHYLINHKYKEEEV